MTLLAAAAAAPGTQADVPRWRLALVVLGVALGLAAGFSPVFNGTLPFFMLPLSQEFGWGRGAISAATVLAMLGVTVGSPFVGRLFDRYGPERLIAVSVVLLAACLWAMSRLPPSIAVLGALCFSMGLAGCATTMVGYVAVLPRWFDQRLGLALGLGGMGLGLGVGIAPFLATQLIGTLGWRGAYTVLAALALGVGMVAALLLRPRRRGGVSAEAAFTASSAASTARRPDAAAAAAVEGLTLAEAARERRFWILLGVTFLVPFCVLGIALHGAALFLDRGLSPAQAAAAAGLAGIGAIVARVAVGALLDRVAAPWVAAVVFGAAGLALVMNSTSTTFAVLACGTFLGGVAMGAEGDLLPFMVRRYFGIRRFGSIFGWLHAAYALGGVLGPIAFGYTFDRAGSYTPIMVTCAAVCALCAAAVATLGPYRYQARPGSAGH